MRLKANEKDATHVSVRTNELMRVVTTDAFDRARVLVDGYWELSNQLNQIVLSCPKQYRKLW